MSDCAHMREILVDMNPQGPEHRVKLAFAIRSDGSHFVDWNLIRIGRDQFMSGIRDTDNILCAIIWTARNT